MSEGCRLKDLENAFQEIQKLLESNVLRDQKSITSQHLDPEGYELQMVYKVRAFGISMESTYSYPERGRPSFYAVRDKIHLRPHSLELIAGKIPDSVLEILKDFFDEQIPKVEIFQSKKFPGTDHFNDRQLLMICYSQSPGEHSFELQSYGSKTFGDMHEDETLFSFHFGQTSEELEVFDYSVNKWRPSFPEVTDPVILFGQGAFEYGIDPTPHRLISKKPAGERYSFILETLCDQTSNSKSNFEKISLTDNVREKTAFLVWDENIECSEFKKEYLKTMERSIQIHAFFVAHEIHNRVFSSEKGIFKKLARLGFEKVVIVLPGFVLQGENEIKQLIHLSLQHPQKFLFFFQKWHNRDRILVANLDHEKATALDSELETTNLESLHRHLPSQSVDEPGPFLFSRQVNSGVVETSFSESFLKELNRDLDIELERGFDKIFLFNTESYDDVMRVSQSQQFRSVIGLASGFKTWFLASQFISSLKKIHVLDFNALSLDLHRCLYERWNGENLPDFLKQEGYQDSMFFQYDERVAWSLWQKETKKWGGAEEFARAWRKLQKVEVEFEQVDLLDNMPLTSTAIQSSEPSVAWFSNIWNNEFAASRFGKELPVQFYQWVCRMKEEKKHWTLLMDHLVINGSVVKFSGKTPDEILSTLEKQVGLNP